MSNVSITSIVKQLANEIADPFTEDKLINLELSLKNRLITEGYPIINAEELAESWVIRLQEEIHVNINDWYSIGLPSPVIIDQSVNNLLITYNHQNYLAFVDGCGLKPEYGNFLTLIRNSSSKEFLIISACLLYIIGCDPIFITDKPGDEGVDCLGQINTGPIRSLCIFVQSKTSTSTISRDQVRGDYKKFCDLKNKALMINYLAALGKNPSSDGLSYCYLFITNNEFQKSAREYSNQDRILIRSCRQIAYFLSNCFDYSNLEKLINDCASTIKCDLNFNLKPVISKYSKRSA